MRQSWRENQEETNVKGKKRKGTRKREKKERDVKLQEM